MSWILDGQRVKAKYYGTSVEGVVTHSRVKYGGEVQYTVELDEPVQLSWATLGDPRTVLLINRSELEHIEEFSG
jgi:hypothetical protein